MNDALTLAECDSIPPTEALQYYESLVAIAGTPSVRTISAWIRKGSFRRRFPKRSAATVLSSAESLNKVFAGPDADQLWWVRHIAAQLVATSDGGKYEEQFLARHSATPPTSLSRAVLLLEVFAYRLFCIEACSWVAFGGNETPARAELLTEFRKQLVESYPELTAAPSDDFLRDRSESYFGAIPERTNMELGELVATMFHIHCRLPYSPDEPDYGYGLFRLIVNNTAHTIGGYGGASW